MGLSTPLSSDAADADHTGDMFEPVDSHSEKKRESRSKRETERACVKERGEADLSGEKRLCRVSYLPNVPTREALARY